MEEQKDPKRDVNQAARHDAPAPAETERKKEREQVKPVQDEPLDPLAPGGIGG